MTGVELIAAERRRQIKDEGWSAEHDDRHVGGELAMAAACFAAPQRIFAIFRNEPTEVSFLDPWPWDREWDKRLEYGSNRREPSTQPANPVTFSKKERLDLLVKAGALIAAEIDRLHRRG